MEGRNKGNWKAGQFSLFFKADSLKIRKKCETRENGNYFYHCFSSTDLQTLVRCFFFFLRHLNLSKKKEKNPPRSTH